MDEILDLDHRLFHLINYNWSNPFFDIVMPFWTDLHKNKPVFLPLVFILLFLAFSKFRRNAFYVAVGATVTSQIADYLSSNFFKLYFLRARPQNAHLGFTVLTPGASYGGTSFPSSHALVFFCVAAYLVFFQPKWRWILFACGFITAYSRVYVAAHFPLDVIGGAAIGYAMGAFLARLSLVGFKQLLHLRHGPS